MITISAILSSHAALFCVAIFYEIIIFIYSNKRNNTKVRGVARTSFDLKNRPAQAVVRIGSGATKLLKTGADRTGAIGLTPVENTRRELGRRPISAIDSGKAAANLTESMTEADGATMVLLEP